MFVKPMVGQRFVVYTDNDVAKRYGTEATTPWKDQETVFKAAAGNFKRSLDYPPSRAGSERHDRNQQAHERGRQRPSVSSSGKSAANDRTH
jgi:hypothetical protein